MNCVTNIQMALGRKSCPTPAVYAAGLQTSLWVARTQKNSCIVERTSTPWSPALWYMAKEPAFVLSRILNFFYTFFCESCQEAFYDFILGSIYQVYLISFKVLILHGPSYIIKGNGNIEKSCFWAHPVTCLSWVSRDHKKHVSTFITQKSATVSS